MSASKDQSRPEERFVAFLVKLVESEDRAPLAALRRGLGKKPGEAADSHPLILPRIPANASPWDEDAYYLTGSLFALHQIDWPAGEDESTRTNLGASFARLGRVVESESIEKRFVALLNCHEDDLPDHLRHAVSLLKSKEIPIDWARLLRDLRRWNHEDRWVQREWARAFWGKEREQAQPTTSTKDNNQSAD